MAALTSLQLRPVLAHAQNRSFKGEEIFILLCDMTRWRDCAIWLKIGQIKQGRGKRARDFAVDYIAQHNNLNRLSGIRRILHEKREKGEIRAQDAVFILKS